ncbi:hypothetical protein KSS87_014131 [Heliosperma pusillum]|nr:hypothetical protein KSS87_014131 [Heliosperma pusillum]
MARKPRRSGLLAPCPFTFSPFGRSISRAAATYSAFNKSSNSKFDASVANHGLKANDPASASDSSEEEAPEVSSSEEGSLEEVVQADFAFFDPKPDNFHGVKTLLPNYLDDKQWDLSGFVDIIIAQTTVGSVVRIEDDEDEGLFAFLTVLNLGRYKDHKCIAELKDYLLKVCPEEGPVGKLKILLGDDAQHVGLIVSQRVTNLPPQLLPPLYDALFDEISWATEDEKIARNKKGSTSGSNEDLIYVKAEDELFHQLCSWSFTFPLKTQPPAAQEVSSVFPYTCPVMHFFLIELKDYRMTGLVIAVKADKSPTFRQQLRSLIDDS